MPRAAARARAIARKLFRVMNGPQFNLASSLQLSHLYLQKGGRTLGCLFRSVTICPDVVERHQVLAYDPIRLAARFLRGKRHSLCLSGGT
jgi:hypothetical protein